MKDNVSDKMKDNVPDKMKLELPKYKRFIITSFTMTTLLGACKTCLHNICLHTHKVSDQPSPSTVIDQLLNWDSKILAVHHINVPYQYQYLTVDVSVSIDPWDDDEVRRVYPNLPTGSKCCKERLQYLVDVDIKAYNKSISEGKITPFPPMEK
jgi:hypothetical protein